MSQIVVPVGLEQQLLSVGQTVELRGASGQMLGVFVPQSAAEPKIDEAEMRRRLAAGGGRPLKEIWQDLGVTQ